MITSILIKNYALIEDIQVELKSGLTTITGETGAGKSIILGALSLLLGKRADLSAVRNPNEKCVIEAHFDLNKMDLEAIFESYDIDYDTYTIIRRELLPKGRSRAFINDSPATLTQIQALAPYLVDIHSQHETLSLFSDKFQLEVIDALANNDALLINYKSKYNEYVSLQKRLLLLKQQHAEAIKEFDYNNFLYNELVEVKLQDVKLTELEEEYQSLNNAEAIQEDFSVVLERLSNDDVGVIEGLKEVRRILSKYQEISAEHKTLWERVHSGIIELSDIETSITEIVETSVANPERVFEISQRLQQIYQLQQKHNLTEIEDLINLEKELKYKVNSSENLDSDIADVQIKIAELTDKLDVLVSEIRANRQSAIPTLKSELENKLNHLGMPNAIFQFVLEKTKDYTPTGKDKIELLFTANKGLAYGPLQKVASGGELSRIMLSIKAVLAQYKELPSLIFDEIDTGVSGEIASKIAVVMKEMSMRMQVLCITHLPQIAAKGKQHLKIYKEDLAHTTVTKLKDLDYEARIHEIAGMLGGEKRTESALRHAKELLN